MNVLPGMQLAFAHGIRDLGITGTGFELNDHVAIYNWMRVGLKILVGVGWRCILRVRHGISFTGLGSRNWGCLSAFSLISTSATTG